MEARFCDSTNLTNTYIMNIMYSVPLFPLLPFHYLILPKSVVILVHFFILLGHLPL